MRKSVIGRELSVEECLAVSGGTVESGGTTTTSSDPEEEVPPSDPSRGGKVMLAGG